MSSTVEQVLKPVASLKLTVALFALSVFLVFAGTLAQVEQGIWTVVSQYFRCLVAWIDLSIFYPGEVEFLKDRGFYFPGGWLLGGLLLINVLAAHTIRFKVKAEGTSLVLGLIFLAAGIGLTWMVLRGDFTKDVAATEGDAFWRVLYRLMQGGGAAVVLWVGCIFLFKRRAGIVLLHGGIILLLMGELVTGLYAREGRMTIAEGESANFVYDLRNIELALIDRSNPGHDQVMVVPDDLLSSGKTISHAKLPVDLEVERYMRNSVEPSREIIAEDNPVTTGFGLQYQTREIAEASGTDTQQNVSMPAAYITFKDKASGNALGTYLLSTYWSGAPQHVRVGNRIYDVALRFERDYRDFAIELIDFRHDRYVGTNKPKNFSSEVRIRDPEHQVDRTVKIWMNNPLRYRGETYYQASFVGEDITVLQVVKNVGWMIPYVACMIVSMGMLSHFGMSLGGFLRKRGAA